MMTVVTPSLFRTKKQQPTGLEQIPSRKQSTKIELYKRLVVANDYIRANYMKNFKLDELAKEALISKYHLLRTYKLVFGITPYQQVLQLRLKLATQLLQESMSLEEVANAVGFSDRRSFTKAFRKAYACSPSEYKKKCY